MGLGLFQEAGMLVTCFHEISMSLISLLIAWVDTVILNRSLRNWVISESVVADLWSRWRRSSDFISSVNFPGRFLWILTRCGSSDLIRWICLLETLKVFIASTTFIAFKTTLSWISSQNSGLMIEFLYLPCGQVNSFFRFVFDWFFLLIFWPVLFHMSSC